MEGPLSTHTLGLPQLNTYVYKEHLPISSIANVVLQCSETDSTSPATGI